MRATLSLCAVNAPEIQKVGTGPLGFFLEAGTLKYIKKMRLSSEASFSSGHFASGGDFDRSGDEVVVAGFDHPCADELAGPVALGIAVG
jgi:hypothetical protein